MPKTGDAIENPITTDRIIFRKTRQDTNGELLQFDNYHKPGGIGPNPHFHPLQEETFEVVNGTFGITRNGEERLLTAGDKAGNPVILQMAATLSYYPGELYLAGNPPVFLQWLLARTLGPVLRRFFGYPVCYPYN